MKVGFVSINNPYLRLETQIDKLQRIGCKKIFTGKHLGLLKEDEFRREQMINYIVKDDIIVVNALSDLGHSLKSVVERISKIHDKGGSILALDESIDTSYDNEYSRAIKATSQMFYQLDQDLIKVRTAIGRACSKVNGKKLGRKAALSDDVQQEVLKAIRDKKSISSLARKYQVSRTTIQRVRARHQTSLVQ